MDRQTLNFLNAISLPGFATKTTSSTKSTGINRHQRRALESRTRKYLGSLREALKEAGGKKGFKAKINPVKYYSGHENEYDTTGDGANPSHQNNTPDGNILWTDVSSVWESGLKSMDSKQELDTAIPIQMYTIGILKPNDDNIPEHKFAQDPQNVQPYTMVSIRRVGDIKTIRYYFTAGSADAVTVDKSTKGHIKLISGSEWKSLGGMKDLAGYGRFHSETINHLRRYVGIATERFRNASHLDVADVNDFKKKMGEGTAYFQGLHHLMGTVDYGCPGLKDGTIDPLSKDHTLLARIDRPEDADILKIATEYFDMERFGDDSKKKVLLTKRSRALKDLYDNAGVQLGYYSKESGGRLEFIPAVKIFAGSPTAGDITQRIARPTDAIDLYLKKIANIEACYRDDSAFNQQAYDMEDLHPAAEDSYNSYVRKLTEAYANSGGVRGLMSFDAIQKVSLQQYDKDRFIDVALPIIRGIQCKLRREFARFSHYRQDEVDQEAANINSPIWSRMDTARLGGGGKCGLALLSDFYRRYILAGRSVLSGALAQRRNANESKFASADDEQDTIGRRSRELNDSKLFDDLRAALVVGAAATDGKVKIERSRQNETHIFSSEWGWFAMSDTVSAGPHKKTSNNVVVMVPPTKNTLGAALTSFISSTPSLKGKHVQKNSDGGVVIYPVTSTKSATVMQTTQALSAAVKGRVMDVQVLVTGPNPNNPTESKPKLINLEEYERIAKKYLENPLDEFFSDDKHNISYYGFDPQIRNAALIKAGQQKEEEEKSEAEDAKLEKELEDLLSSPKSEYTKKTEKLKELFHTLYGATSDETLKYALKDIGEFTYHDEEYPESRFYSYVFDSYGQLYRVSKGGDGKKVATVIPGNVLDESSIYNRIINNIAAAAAGDPSRIRAHQLSKLFPSINSSDPNTARKAKAIMKWANDLVDKIAETKRGEDEHFIKAVAALSSVYSINKVDIGDSLRSPEKFHTGEISYADTVQLSSAVREKYKDIKDYLKTKIKLQILGNKDMVREYGLEKFDPKVRQELQAKANQQLVNLQSSLSSAAALWRDARTSFAATALSNDEDRKMVRDMMDYDSDGPEDEGMIDKFINGIARMVENTFERFTNFIFDAFEAFTNFDLIHANFEKSFTRSFAMSINMFFNMLWSDFTDSHFGSSRLRWARDLMHNVGGQVVGAKHLSQETISKIEKKLGVSSGKEPNAAQRAKSSMLIFRAQPSYQPTGSEAYIRNRNAAFHAPEITMPLTRTGESMSDDEFMVTYQVANEDAAKELGYSTEFTTGSSAFRQWWETGAGRKVNDAHLSGMNMLVPTSFHDQKTGVLRHDYVNNKGYLKPHSSVIIDPDGRRLHIRFRLRDIGLTPDQVYTKEDKQLVRAQNKAMRDRLSVGNIPSWDF